LGFRKFSTSDLSAAKYPANYTLISHTRVMRTDSSAIMQWNKPSSI